VEHPAGSRTCDGRPEPRRKRILAVLLTAVVVFWPSGRNPAAPRLRRHSAVTEVARSMGANVGATRANSFPRQVDEYGQATGDHARSRTGLDDAERLTGIYGSEGWGFESLRARPGQRPIAILQMPQLLPKGPS